MENEKFGVELELVTSKFSQKMESIKSKISNFGKMAKANLETGMYMDISQAKTDLQTLQNELKQLTSSTYEWTPLETGEIVDTKDRIAQLNTKIADLKKDINTFETSKIAKIGRIFTAIKGPIDKIKTSIKGSKDGMNEFEASVNKTFKSGISSIKRFALSLFGIQSIWRAVSRASSAYLSQDIELSNKLQAVWVGLGSIFAPIIEKVADFFLKLVGYINVFIKALTGVDLLGKAMAKANTNTKKTSKSVKELKGQLAGFDEINNIADDSSSGDSGATVPDVSWTDAFANVQLDTSWTEAITNFGNWVRDNWQLVVVGITGIALVIGALNLASTLAGVGLTGMLIPLLAIAVGVTGLISLVLGIIELFKEGGDQTKAWTLILGGLVAIVIAVGIAFGAIPMAIAAVVAAVTAGVLWIIKNWEDVKSTIQKGLEAIKKFFLNCFTTLKDLVVNFPVFLKSKFGLVGELIAQPFEIGIKTIKGVWNGAKQFFQGVKDFFVGIFTLDGAKITSGLKSMLSGMGNIIIAFIEGAINGFLIPINSAIKIINKIPGVDIPQLSVKIPRFPSLDVGTNYVPEDQFAYIHKGEAVVPKKFNNDTFFGNGNEETNELLRELIEVIEDKDSNTYLDGKVIGKVARDYIVNQNRIMGRSVI